MTAEALADGVVKHSLTTYRPEPDEETYGDDDWNPGETRSHRVLNLRIGGGDYFLSVDHEDSNGVLHSGPLVRIRTSDSNDPRNLAVIMALAQLRRALKGGAG